MFSAFSKVYDDIVFTEMLMLLLNVRMLILIGLELEILMGIK